MKHVLTLNGNVTSLNNRCWCCDSPHAVQDYPLHNLKFRVRWTPSALSHGVRVFGWYSKFLATRSAESDSILIRLWPSDLQNSFHYCLWGHWKIEFMCNIHILITNKTIFEEKFPVFLYKSSVNIFNRGEACQEAGCQHFGTVLCSRISWTAGVVRTIKSSGGSKPLLQ